MATWVIGDIHGYYDSFMSILNNSEVSPDDSFILLGDIIDRGPDILKMLFWAMENITENGKYQMVCGNHEDTVITAYDREKAAYEKEHGTTEGFEYEDVGPLNCRYKFQDYMKEYGYETMDSIKPFVEWFKTLPIKKDISVITDKGNRQDYIIVHAWWRKDIERHSAVWERDISDESGFHPDYEPEHGEILIHGHTPIFRELGYPDDAKVYFRDHSINIDCGAAYPEAGGRLAAIRLEDRKVIYSKGR